MVLKEDLGVCYQWRAKGQCSRGDNCSFRHVQNRPPKTSRKRNLRGRSPSGKTNRQQCRDFLKGTCTKLPCDCWDPPECHFLKSEMGCTFGDKCSFPHWKVEEQPSEKPKKGGDKSAVATVKDVRLLGCVLQDTEPAGILSDSTQEAQKSWDPFNEYDSKELRCVRRTSEKTKVPSLKKIQVKVPHQRSPLRYQN